MSLRFSIWREGRSDVCLYCTRHYWYMVNVCDIFLMCCVWLDQSNYKLGRARGSHDNIRWREMSTPPSKGFDWSVQTDPIRTFVKTLSTNGNGAVEMLARVQLLSQHYLL